MTAADPVEISPRVKGRGSPGVGAPLLAASAACALGLLPVAAARAADVYDDAVQHSGRTGADLERDALDHPAEVLRLSGIKRGMRVADLEGADGYYTELLSYVVGPDGHVLLLNDPSFERWSESQWRPRVATAGCPTWSTGSSI